MKTFATITSEQRARVLVMYGQLIESEVMEAEGHEFPGRIDLSEVLERLFKFIVG